MIPHPARYPPVRGVSSVPTFSLRSAVLVVGPADRVAALWSASFFDSQIFDRPVKLVNLFSRFQNGALVTTAPPTPSFDLAVAVKHLSERDEKLKFLIAETAPFQMDQDHLQSPYEALLEAIAYQSISGKAAATIFARIKALSSNGRPPSPQEMLKLRKQALRKAGLSGAKVVAMKDLAKKTIEGVVPTLEDAQKLSDEELVERLTSVRGIGAWTVEMFLIFRLGRPDVLPIHDLGVQKGWSITYGKKHKPKPKELLAFGERWRPYRTVASWYMWRACQRAGNAAMRKIRPAKVRPKPRRKVKSKARKV
jgi:DNA-3-methyladenine glycosylase II